MTEFLNDWGLILITFVPLLGALAMLFVPKESESTHKMIALVTSLAALFVGLLLLLNFNYSDAGNLQFVVDKQWIEVINS
jgi:NADH-quinone oxidoreductase subunit M